DDDDDLIIPVEEENPLAWMGDESGSLVIEDAAEPESAQDDDAVLAASDDNDSLAWLRDSAPIVEADDDAAAEYGVDDPSFDLFGADEDETSAVSEPSRTDMLLDDAFGAEALGGDDAAEAEWEIPDFEDDSAASPVDQPASVTRRGLTAILQ